MHALPPRADDPIGFAHRGGGRGRRENTLAAFASALALGATGLESDAWVTLDGYVVLHHDGETGPRWRRRLISAQPRSALPAHVPALGELYGRCGRDFELSLDIKDRAALPAILATAGAAGATSRLWLCHHDWRWLASRRAASGDARLVQSTRLARIEEGLATRVASLRDGGIDALNLHRADWTAAGVATVHTAGLHALAWGAQARQHMMALLGMGVDGVYSDHVGRLMDAISAGPRRLDGTG